jgi:prepilin-type N-terminal cleavage/methylation domain-containing protein
MKTERDQRAAFSLIEVMCATVILAIGVVGLTTAITTALGSSKESELQSTAAMIAAGQIETLRAGGFVSDGNDEGEFGGGLSLYRWKQTIVPTQIDGLHEVTVTVENAKSGQQIYELKTMLFDAPLDRQDEKDKTRDKKKETNKRQGRNR